MTEKIKNITIALAGNPNSGKTTVFNSLTGMRQHVGNYPGVTVEKKEGLCHHKDFVLNIVDLPGTYSLTAYSAEEIVARNFIVEEKPDVVVDVIDSANIERNLYLAVQLMEMEAPIVLAFNMSDVAKNKGLIFDIEMLSSLFGLPIVQTIGNKDQGINELLEATVKTAQDKQRCSNLRIKYGKEIEDELEKLQQQLQTEKDLLKKFNSRWIAVKLLEQDEEILKQVKDTKVLDAAQDSINHLREIFGEEPEIIIADRRYGFISGACQEAVKNTIETRHNRSDMIDAVVTHRVFGLPIFVALMYIVFDLTFRIGKWPMGWLEGLFGFLSRYISGFWPTGQESLIKSLIVDGILGGVGGVVIFLPNILLLFMAIAVLEGTGYMARAAFVTDRIMHKIGLHGKSFIPMLIGFGCTVPAIMACRILENRRNRITTILVLPLFSCGARITIYALFIPAFFALKWRGAVMLLIYFIGIVLAVIAAKILRLTLLRGETVPFVMELPPYRMPTFKAILIHMWERGWLYLKKAGTVILVISVILWFAGNFPRSAVEQEEEDISQKQILEYSITGRLSGFLEPAFKPLGFDKRIVTALIGAMAAKEVFVAQMGITYAISEHEDVSVLREKLRADYTPLQAFCIMLFCLISAPCVATVAVTRAETGRIGWAIFQWAGLTALAYVVTLVVYQLGMYLS
ncbi:MAG: ferrous iron transport protein B [Sedimentisphaerales bacterium]|nr:ferrous iron transport protein B [Sedimentisphaerales bacterium]